MTSTRTLALCGAFAALLAVALGAFGAHALRDVLAPEQIAVYQTAVSYQMWHALATLLCATLVHSGLAGVAACRAGWLFVLGMVLFSGSLYALVLSGMRGLGMITPVGGLCFMGGWLLLALHLFNGKDKP